MNTNRWVGMGLLSLMIVAVGCSRISMQMTEKPRVDQALQGNRGTLQGQAPEAPPRKTTRQYMEVNVDLPTAQELNPWRKPPAEAAPSIQVAQAAGAAQPPTGPAAARERLPKPPLSKVTPPVSAPAFPEMEPPAPVEPTEVPHQIYAVQQGDTLEKIAATVYGDSRQWKRIFEANRKVLRSPDRIYVGQKLVIPPLERKEQGTQRAGLEEVLK